LFVSVMLYVCVDVSRIVCTACKHCFSCSLGSLPTWVTVHAFLVCSFPGCVPTCFRLCITPLWSYPPLPSGTSPLQECIGHPAWLPAGFSRPRLPACFLHVCKPVRLGSASCWADFEFMPWVSLRVTVFCTALCLRIEPVGSLEIIS